MIYKNGHQLARALEGVGLRVESTGTRYKAIGPKGGVCRFPVGKLENAGPYVGRLLKQLGTNRLALN